MKHNNNFLLFIIDDDKKLFSIIGPMADDRYWTHKIHELIQSGRNVRCMSSENYDSINIEASKFSQISGYTYSKENIVEEPESHSLSFEGYLPVYASRANRKRVIKLICRGKCRSATRWGEMNQDYPGQDILKKTEFGVYQAQCLKCGYLAQDSYNWYR
ncbi:MAG TPA: hypothetical protein PLP19_14720 [bacterium]|nr:hypothetical protein [bacterium]HPN44743.1 hypothetical protein [bacterium]